jgi:hypothetical protein
MATVDIIVLPQMEVNKAKREKHFRSSSDGRQASGPMRIALFARFAHPPRRSIARAGYHDYFVATPQTKFSLRRPRAAARTT